MEYDGQHGDAMQGMRSPSMRYANSEETLSSRAGMPLLVLPGQQQSLHMHYSPGGPPLSGNSNADATNRSYNSQVSTTAAGNAASFENTGDFRGSPRSSRQPFYKAKGHEQAGSAMSPPESTREMTTTGGGSDTAGDRKTTDPHWLVAFFLFLMIGSGVAFDSVMKGNIRSLYKGVNYSGLVCGVDAPVADTPYLYFPLDPTKAPDVVLLENDGRCVKSCPTKDDVENGVSVSIAQRDHKLDSKHGSAIAVEFKLQSPVYATYCFAESICLPLDKDLSGQILPHLSSYKSQLRFAIAGLASAWPIMLAYISLGFTLTTLFWILISRVSIGIIVFTSAAGLVTSSLVGGVYAICKGAPSQKFVEGTEAVSRLFSINFPLRLLVGSSLLSLGVVAAILILSSHSAGPRCRSMLDTAATTIGDIPSIFVPSLIMAAGIMMFLIIWCFVLLKILSRQDLAFDLEVIPLDPNGAFVVFPLHRSTVFSKGALFSLMYWFTVLFVVLETALSSLNFVLCYTGTVWYFSPPEGADSRVIGWFPSLVAVNFGLTHHIGSFTSGGVVMGLTRPIRTASNIAKIISASCRQQSDEDGSRGGGSVMMRGGRGGPIMMPLASGEKDDERDSVGGGVIGALADVVVRATSWADFINVAGFIEMSISSTPMLLSMKTARSRQASCPGPAVAFTGASGLVQTLWNMFIAITITVLTYASLLNLSVFSSVSSASFLPSPIIVSMITGGITGCVSSHVTCVWDTVSEALLYCYIMESAGNGGAYDANPVTRVHAHAELKELMLTEIEREVMMSNGASGATRQFVRY